jgi:hypothetical protein
MHNEVYLMWKQFDIIPLVRKDRAKFTNCKLENPKRSK